MNIDSLNNALLLVLNKSITALEKGGEFLAEQLPDVIQQLLMWHLVRSSVMFASTVVCFALLLWLLKYTFNKWVREEDASEANILLVVPLFFLGLFIFLTFNITWIQILVAPKVYLIEYAASLVK